MDFAIKEFGFCQGYPCFLISFMNDAGFSATFTNFGAAVTSLCVPDKNGNPADVVLGYDTLEEYVKGNSCHGATVGRFANRIGGAKFTLEGVEYHLAKNDGENTLHGGFFGYNKRVWETVKLDVENLTVEFEYRSHDGEEHFPSRLITTASYTLLPNGLKIKYTANSNVVDTVVNLTNHSYFNLKGEGSGDIKDHIVQINAERYTPVDSGLIPTGELADVANTPFDFRSPKRVGEDMDNGRLPVGYDNNFVLGLTKEMREAATVYEPTSGRFMTVHTDKPGIQFYVGIGLDGERGKNGHSYNKYAGLCLESQFFPDSPNKPHFPSSVLKAGSEYEFTTTYTFSTK